MRHTTAVAFKKLTLGIFVVILGLLFGLVVFHGKHHGKEEVVNTQPMDTSLKKWIGYWKRTGDLEGTRLVLDEEDGMLVGYETNTTITSFPPYIFPSGPKYMTNIKKVDDSTITYDIVGEKQNGWTCPMRKIVWTPGLSLPNMGEIEAPSAKYHVFKKDGSLENTVMMKKE